MFKIPEPNTTIENNIPEGFSSARITEVNKNNYMISTGETEMVAELSGKFIFEAEGATDYPTVGDFVVVNALDENSLAIIHSVLPRKTLLKRKESGKRVEFQLIAANIDYGIIVQSADNLNMNLLDRYFVMLIESRIEPLVVLSKTDLIKPAELEILKNNLKNLKYRYIFLSNITENGNNELVDALEEGKTYCLLGQSGVGKTSLLNRLLGTAAFKVNEVREKDGKGRHTTVRRQLTVLESGSIFIDTPGIRELGNFDVGHGIEETFSDIAELASKCHYRDCTHTHENGCAIIDAVNSDQLDYNRYNNFLKLKKESQFYDMSYQEKRNKDKSFGKMIKNYKKFKGKS